MTFATSTRSIEITRSYLHLRLKRLEVFLEQDPAAPMLGFEKRAHDGGGEFWCLGFHVVYDWNN